MSKDIQLVYRVENSDGNGPYWGRIYNDDPAIDAMHAKHNAHRPTPQEDGLGWPEDDEFCGFDSIESLKKWFKGFQKALGRNGYRLGVYETPTIHVRRGNEQVLFNKNKAKLTETKGLARIPN